MNIFIDCEWNEFGGDLISMALVADTKCFYEVLPCENPGPWVAENVIPHLQKEPANWQQFQTGMGAFLNQFEAIHIIADWPEDIMWFCKALITGPGERMSTPPLTMEVRRDIGNDSALVLHNALSDAIAIRDSYNKLFRSPADKE